MNTVLIKNIPESIMRKVDFQENEIYLTVCGKHYKDLYDGKKEERPSSAQEGAPKGLNKNRKNPLLKYIKKFKICQGVIL